MRCVGGGDEEVPQFGSTVPERGASKAEGLVDGRESLPLQITIFHYLNNKDGAQARCKGHVLNAI